MSEKHQECSECGKPLAHRVHSPTYGTHAYREPVASPQATRPPAYKGRNGVDWDAELEYVKELDAKRDAAQPAAGTTPLIESDLKDAVMFLRIVLTRKDMTALNCLKPKIADWLKRRGHQGSILRETE